MGVLGGSLFALTSMTLALAVGPVSGLFFMGMLFPKVKKSHIMIGFVVSFIFIATVSSMSLVMPKRYDWEALPLSTEGCPASNANVTVLGYTEGQNDAQSLSTSMPVTATYNRTVTIEKEKPFR